MNKNDQPECEFELNERVKLSREALRYAKDPSQFQRWKKDRGNVTETRFWEGKDCETGEDITGWLIRVDFTDEHLQHVSFTEEQLVKSRF